MCQCKPRFFSSRSRAERYNPWPRLYRCTCCSKLCRVVIAALARRHCRPDFVVQAGRVNWGRVRRELLSTCLVACCLAVFNSIFHHRCRMKAKVHCACLTIMLVASSLWSIKAALTMPQRDALVRRSGVSRNLFERCISAAAVVATVLHAFVSAYVVTHETYFPRHSQLSIYSALKGSTWTSKTGWTTATPDGCAWSGVTCLGVEIE